MNSSALIMLILLPSLISIGTQAYGSTQGTNQCDLSVIQSCPQSSQAESKTASETSQTPLIIPNFSPTREDLDNTEADEGARSADSDDNDDATSSTLADSGDNDNAENSDDEQAANDEDSSDGDGPSVIPFP